MINRMDVTQYQFKHYIIQKIDRITHSNFSKPSQVFFAFSGKCNLRCLQCSIWKNKNLAHINGDELKRIIGDLYSYLGPIKISLSGAGEPFMEPGLLNACEYAASLGIPIIINTNGTLIDDDVAKKIIKAGIFGITISVDGLKSHDIIRGAKGTFLKVTSCIKSLIKWNNYYKSNLRIMINTIIMSLNLNELIGLAKWSKYIGASIKYIPLTSCLLDKNNLWPTDRVNLHKTLLELKALTGENENILNSQRNFDQIEEYYLNPNPHWKSFNCLSMYDRISIRSNKNVCICGNVIGNLSNNSIEEILKSTKANEIRNKLRKCNKSCIHNCWSQGSFMNKARLLYKYCYN